MVFGIDEALWVGAYAVVEGEGVVGGVEEGTVFVDVEVFAIGELGMSANVAGVADGNVPW